MITLEGLIGFRAKFKVLTIKLTIFKYTNYKSRKKKMASEIFITGTEIYTPLTKTPFLGILLNRLSCM